MRTRLLGLLLCLALPGSAHAAPGTWVPTLTVGVQGSDTVNAFRDGTVYELHRGGGVQGFYRSTDFGTTWTPLPDPPAAGFGVLGFSSARIGFAADENAVVRRTTDGSATWVPTRALPTKAGNVLSASAMGVAKDRQSLYVAGWDYKPLRAGCNEPAASPLWSSADSGRSWIRFDLGPRQGASRIKAYDHRRAVAIVYDYRPSGECQLLGDRNAIYTTEDGGRSWKRRLDCPVGHLCTSAAFVSPTRILVGRTEGTTAVSTDAGRTFRAGPSFVNALPKAADSAQYYWVQGITFADQRRGWLSVKGVGTYRTDDAGAHWELEHSQDEAFGLGVGDADAADFHHAVVAGPTLVSTRVADGGPQRARAQVLRAGIAASTDRLSLDATGVLRVRY